MRGPVPAGGDVASRGRPGAAPGVGGGGVAPRGVGVGGVRLGGVGRGGVWGHGGGVAEFADGDHLDAEQGGGGLAGALLGLAVLHDADERGLKAAVGGEGRDRPQRLDEG